MTIKNITGAFINLYGLITNQKLAKSDPVVGNYSETGINAAATIDLLLYNTPGRIFECFELWRQIVAGSIVVFCDGVQLSAADSLIYFQTLGFQCAFNDATFSTKQLKAGEVIPASFAGTPLKYTVVFSTAYPDAVYFPSVTALGDGRIFSVESKTSTGFTINTNSSVVLLNSVAWMAIKY